MRTSALDIQDMVYGCDPLARAVARLTGRHLWGAVLIAVIYQLVTRIIPAVLISCFYEGNRPFISLFQYRECTMVGIWEVIIPISIFAFWAWQPIGVEMLIKRLRLTGVVPMLTDDGALHDFLQRRIAKPLNQPWTLMITLLVAVPVFFLGHLLTWYGAQLNPVWWSINPLYFWGVYSVSGLIACYVLWWALIRQFVVIRALYTLFRDSAIKPQIMHPDGCMGFAAIGDYALMFCTPVMLFALGWTMSLLVMPITTGEEPTLLSTFLCIIAVYPIFLSAFIIVPALAPHRPLKKARDKALETVAVPIRQWLSDVGNDSNSINTETIRTLEHKYTMILENYTTWPFRTRVLRTFCIVAIIPILPTVISIVLEILGIRLIQR